VASFSPDGRLLASEGPGSSVRLWDVATGQEVRRASGHKEAVWCVAFAPDGKVLVTGSRDGTLRTWEADTGRELRVFSGHPNAIVAAAFSRDGRTMASVDIGGIACLWETATGKERHRFQLAPDPGSAWRRMSGLTLSSDGTILVFLHGDGVISLWNTATGQKIRQLEVQGAWLTAVALSPDGKILAAGTSESDQTLPTVYLWRLDSENENDVCRIKPAAPNPGESPPWNWYSDRGERMDALMFSADAKLLVGCRGRITKYGGGTYDHTIHTWEIATGEELFKLKPTHEPAVLALSPDGKSLLLVPTGRIGADRGGLAGFSLWDLPRGKLLGWVEGHRAGVQCLAFSHDGRRLATGSYDNTALVWETSWPGLRHRVRPVAAPPPRWSEDWAALAAPAAARAYESVWRLAAFPDQTVPFLRKHLTPVTDVDRRRIAQMITDLDSDLFAVRQQARQWLGQHDEVAESALREVLRSRPTLEVRRQVEDLLRDFENKAPPPERLRALRGTTVLECIGNAEARRLLEVLAGGAPEARLTREAKASLERLVQRPEPPR
jgi:WD40 repeat protein